MQIPEISHDICTNPDFINLPERPLCASSGLSLKAYLLTTGGAESQPEKQQ
jgi:hypothetical protein